MAKLVCRLVGSSTTLIQTEICRLFDGLPRNFGRGGDALGFILRGCWTSVQSSHWCDFIKHHYVFAKKLCKLSSFRKSMQQKQLLCFNTSKVSLIAY